MTRRPATVVVGAMVAVALLGGCAQEPQRPQVTVYAAASLTSAVSALAQAFAHTHPEFEVHAPVFDGSSALAMQLVEGAPATVFAAADPVTMRVVEESGLLASEPEPFATNTMQLAVAAGNPLGIDGLGDLDAPGLEVVVCAREVPCGAVARSLLDDAGVALQVASEEQNVAAVATKVRVGEADAGLVYATDILAAGGQLDGVTIEGADKEANTYEIAVVDSRWNSAATEFVRWVLSAEGRSTLAAHGFGEP